ncbi:regulatory protein, FmdB family [Pirellula staleyi DSM 6068]|uniref:Regulatory protein, FmdB family n=1 Tax=Pirellula staleyi (strain ATCC 27377 / DSM 6068 / ICPB 4128) TaxID=530564 RepID=D2QYP7_PIRSD|nr:zinc ribbon domain-containing protein [Pirellula staleyi]ADB18206.1 regulatory protein, FmdB family [Pirellula staleyi DSM 6068]
MPLYEYHCPSCESEFELLVRSDDTPACPSCESPKIERLLSAPAAHTSGASLPMAQSMPGGGCGKPQCGQGFCGMGG